MISNFDELPDLTIGDKLKIFRNLTGNWTLCEIEVMVYDISEIEGSKIIDRIRIRYNNPGARIKQPQNVFSLRRSEGFRLPEWVRLEPKQLELFV